MEKTEIAEKIVELLRARRDTFFQSYETHRQASIEAPSRMQSRHDTSREELGRIADSAARNIEQLDKLIAHIEGSGTADKKFTRIRVGALVSVIEGEKRFYVYLTPEGAGGEQLEIEGMAVYTISPSSPIGKSLIAKEIDDEAVFLSPASPTGTRTLIIEDVQ